MPALSRREAIAAATLASLAAALPAWAQEAAATAAQWDLTDLYPDAAAWDAARLKVLAAIPSLTQYQGRLGESAETLATFMVAQSDLNRQGSRVVAYASLKADEDLRVAANQERKAQAIDMSTAVGEATAWVSPELLALGKAKIDQFVAANATLKKRFDFALADTLRQADHTLSPESEALLAGAGSPLSGPRDIREQLVASDIPWPTVTLSTGKQVRLDDQGYTLTRDAPNRADRKLVFDSFWAEYGKFANSLGAAYASKVKADIFRKKARNYPTSLAAALSGNNVPRRYIAHSSPRPTPACRSCTVISSCAASCSGCPTWPITTSIRRWCSSTSA